MNLYRPFTAMSELWRASQSPGKWTSSSSAGLVPLWWTLWILNLVLERITQQVIKRAVDLDSLILGTRFAIATAIFGIPLALVAIQMVRKIQAMQDDWSSGIDRDGLG
jgi:hypothetical protein